jgi:hypothetical protein
MGSSGSMATGAPSSNVEIRAAGQRPRCVSGVVAFGDEIILSFAVNRRKLHRQQATNSHVMQTMHSSTQRMIAATRAAQSRATAMVFYGYWFSRSGV